MSEWEGWRSKRRGNLKAKFHLERHFIDWSSGSRFSAFFFCSPPTHLLLLPCDDVQHNKVVVNITHWVAIADGRSSSFTRPYTVIQWTNGRSNVRMDGGRVMCLGESLSVHLLYICLLRRGSQFAQINSSATADCFSASPSSVHLPPPT